MSYRDYYLKTYNSYIMLAKALNSEYYYEQANKMMELYKTESSEEVADHEPFDLGETITMYMVA